jgi:histidyl-tRNA synthetase
VTVYPEADKLGKQIKYADSIGVPYVCIAGDEEIAKGVVKVKRMDDGNETTQDATSTAALIRAQQ